jgi:hypothetical protein
VRREQEEQEEQQHELEQREWQEQQERKFHGQPRSRSAVPAPTPNPQPPRTRLEAFMADAEGPQVRAPPKPRAGEQPGCRCYCYDSPLIKRITRAHGSSCEPAKAVQMGDTAVLKIRWWFYSPSATGGAASSRSRRSDCDDGGGRRRHYLKPTTKTAVVLGAGQLARGVDISLSGMCVGETRELRIPPELDNTRSLHGGGRGHGQQGTHGAPPDTAVFALVTLLQGDHLSGFRPAAQERKCRVGSYHDLLGGGGCRRCPQGKFQPLRGQAGCYQCTAQAREHGTGAAAGCFTAGVGSWV